MPTDPPPEAAPDVGGGVPSRRARRADVPTAQTPARLVPGADSEGKTLTIPRSISYSGRIGSCERLMVEGAVEPEPETTVPPWHLQPAKPRCTPISRIPPTSGEIHQPINVTKTTALLSN